MKKHQKNLAVFIGILVASMLLTLGANAQGFKGIATYKSDRNMSDFQFEGEGMSPDMMEKMKAQLKSQFQKEYELRFNLTESTWKEAESLDGGPATASAGGMVLSISMGGGTSYKNTATKEYIQETESFSKLFLITDELKDREWKMTGKTKKIGDYTANEAVFQNIREVRRMSFSNGENTTEMVMDTTNITVWYTPEIPVPHGPDDYWGLPGLILEMTDGKVSYLCTKVVLNPEKGVVIEKPKKGKKISEKDFQKLSEEMSQKMMKKYSGGQDGDEHVMSIQIGN